MSRKQLFNTMSREISRLNREIDMKIVRGTSYRHDALRHKTLLSQISRNTQRDKLSRAFSFLSFL